MIKLYALFYLCKQIAPLYKESCLTFPYTAVYFVFYDYFIPNFLYINFCNTVLTVLWFIINHISFFITSIKHCLGKQNTLKVHNKYINVRLLVGIVSLHATISMSCYIYIKNVILCCVGFEQHIIIQLTACLEIN